MSLRYRREFWGLASRDVPHVAQLIAGRARVLTETSEAGIPLLPTFLLVSPGDPGQPLVGREEETCKAGASDEMLGADKARCPPSDPCEGVRVMGSSGP